MAYNKRQKIRSKLEGKLKRIASNNEVDNSMTDALLLVEILEDRVKDLEDRVEELEQA